MRQNKQDTSEIVSILLSRTVGFFITIIDKSINNNAMQNLL
jgi:hypothetical protein